MCRDFLSDNATGASVHLVYNLGVDWASNDCLIRPLSCKLSCHFASFGNRQEHVHVVFKSDLHGCWAESISGIGLSFLLNNSISHRFISSVMVIDIFCLTNSFSQLNSGLCRMRSNGSLMRQNIAVGALEHSLGDILGFSTGGYGWTEGPGGWGGHHRFEQLGLDENGHCRFVSRLDHPSLSDE